MKNEPTQRCANCGTPLTDEYCPHCGQAVSRSGRLTLRSFLKGSVLGLFSFDSGFFYTFYRLVTTPWVVVRDYIHGRRVNYTIPSTMLVMLVLYVAIISNFVGAINHSFSAVINLVYEPAEGEENLLSTKLIQLFFSIISSQEFIYVVLAIPVVIAVYITYFRFGSRRYNLAEYLAASIYMFCMWLCYDIIFMLLPDVLDDYYLNVLVPAVISCISLCKAFRVKNLAVRLLLVVVAIAISLLLMLLAAYAISFMLNGDASALDVTTNG
jgi:hypothetical protein